MLTVQDARTTSFVPLKADSNQLIVLAQGGGLERACIEGRLFSVANQAKVATTAAFATTWTGLGISNPSGSGKNLILHEFGAELQIASDAAGVVGLMTSDTTGFAAALTIRNCLDGTEAANASIAYADDGATIATPVLRRVCGTYGTAAITAMQLLGPQIYKINGALVIPPGRSVMTYTTTATTAAFVFHFVWEEKTVES
jgi:hypothetical protein